MRLEAGIRLGPYEIQAPIGAGGMGEVYRARDTRLGRIVAIKVLPESFAEDPDRLRRFEQEARAVAALNHPNILTLFDVGSQEGTSYLVEEFLEGQTLRAALEGGPLRARRAIEVARDIASALAAAHAKGIVHRDLKPENVIVTREGRAKVLDFGLARFALPSARVSQSPTATKPGSLMGTVGYMSPEQVRGQDADARSDIFAFGSVLYEVLTGRHAFEGESPVETMNAILKDDPPDVPATQETPPALDRLLRHCLEKDPARRFQSAQDLAFDLDGLFSSTPSTAGAIAPGRGMPRRNWLGLATSALAGSVATGSGLVATGFRYGAKEWTSQRLTFRRGFIFNARFASDGKTIVYSATWDGEPQRIFTTRLGSPESAALDLEGDSWLFSVSSKDEVAVGTGPFDARWTLTRVPLSGGAPKAILDDVRAADWGPDGESLAVAAGGRADLLLPGLVPRRVEYPIGNRLFDVEAGWVGSVRVSPDGGQVAFTHEGQVWLVDRAARVRRLSSHVRSVEDVALPARGGSIAWAPSGRAILVAARNGERGALEVRRLSLSGQNRPLFRSLGNVSVTDAQASRLLLLQETIRGSVLARAPGASAEKDLAWLDYSILADMSRDGTLALFSEDGEGGGGHGMIYLRRTDGSPATKIGPGHALALSPDGRWVAAKSDLTGEVSVLPTGAGSARKVSLHGLIPTWVWFTLDASALLIYGSEQNHSLRFFLVPVEGGTPRPLTPEGISGQMSLSPDGQWLAVSRADGRLDAYPLAGGQPRVLPRVEPGELPIQWSSDGRALFVGRFLRLPVRVYRLDLETGARSLWRSLSPSDPAGIYGGVNDLFVAPDGSSYCYSAFRWLSELHVVEGLL